MPAISAAEEVAFRKEVRDFLQANMPPDIADTCRRLFHILPEDSRRWNAILHKRGWVAPGWAREYGGPGWSAVQRQIFDEECALVDAPLPLMAGQGIPLVGPLIYTFGSKAQKEQYLPRMLSGEDYWAQGFSEPGSGSDLASLSTRAQRDDQGYLVNGQKIWTSLAHNSNMIYLLARTDPAAKPQRGISMFVFPIDLPGIEIRPIISIDRGHSLNEVFFNDVRLPHDALVGEENKGWSYAKFLLEHERLTVAEVGRSMRRLERLRGIARDMPGPDGGRLADDPVFADRLARVAIDLVAVRELCMRTARDIDAGRAVDLTASVIKLRGTEVLQQLTELAIEAAGLTGLAYDARPDHSQASPPAPPSVQGRMEEFLFLRAATIYGGSTETQKNIVAKLIFAGA